MWLISLYLFSTGVIISSLLVVTNAKAINAIISLIAAFLNAIGIFMLLGVDFIALIYCIVYVGAIAILFLFVIMLLSDTVNNERLEGALSHRVSANTSSTTSATSFKISEHSPMVVLIGVLYIVEVWCGIAASSQNKLPTADFAENNSLASISGANEVISLLHNKNSISALGEMLFNECGYEVLLSISLILLVGMIGSIILSLRPTLH